MRILTDLSAFVSDPKRPLTIALGNFDGVHLGHRALLQCGLDEAVARNGQAAVFTFQQHPQRILHPEYTPSLLTVMEHKIYLLEKMNVDLCFLLPFTKPFSEMEAPDFVRRILVEQLKVHQVCMGFNARFGHERRGDKDLMRKLADSSGFKFRETPPVEIGGKTVSSSRIRNLIRTGSLKEAGQCLGRPFSVFGKVVAGDKRGAQIGFPTANLDCGNSLLPPEGVYPVRARVMKVQKDALRAGMEAWHIHPEGDPLRGVLNYGRRPTFEDKGNARPVAEVHLLDFTGDLYGWTLEIEFCPKIREEKACSGVAALQRQIEQDIRQARAYFERHPGACNRP